MIFHSRFFWKLYAGYAVLILISSTMVGVLISQRVEGEIYTAIALGGGISILAPLFLGLFLTRHFVKQLTSMIRVAESMSHGEDNKGLPATRQDEVGQLAQALNRMAERCRVREDTISADRNKLSAILSGMAEGVVAVNRHEHVIHLNQAAGKLLDISSEESLEKPIWEIAQIREVAEILRLALRGEINKQQNIQLSTLQKDQYIEMHASSLHDEEDKLVGAVVVLQDVSTLHRLESVRRDFVANASHELKTPITAIRGLIETLIDDKELPAPTRERFLGKIKNQSIRLSSLVTDLLTLSRLESESHEWEELPFDLSEVLLDASKTFIPGGEEEGVKVKIQVPDVSVEVRGDREALSQLVNNLIDNALKYTPRGGRVSARIFRRGDEALIEVQDTGIGIASKDRDRIFERFYRVDKARSRELGGTGLGLSIVKHIALVHGGRVDVDSQPGIGSTFRIFLPLASSDISSET